MAVGGAEEHFAKKLAHNDKKIRDRAVKRLQAWITSRKETGRGFGEVDLLKIWKGLFYCFWMSDKPLVQEELAGNISNLIHSFKTQDSAIIFIITFFKTMHREWHGIDRLRMDKFYMLIRSVVKEVFVLLVKKNWPESLCERVCTVLRDGPLNPTDEKVPAGMRLHMSSIYLQELQKATDTQVPLKVALQLLEPFLQLAAFTKNPAIANGVKAGIFDTLLENGQQKDEESDQEEDEKESLKVDYKDLADKLFALASDRQVLGRNRNVLYQYVKKFKKFIPGAETEEDSNANVILGSKRKLSPETTTTSEVGDEVISKKKNKKHKPNTEEKEDSSHPEEDTTNDKQENKSKKKKKENKKADKVEENVDMVEVNELKSDELIVPSNEVNGNDEPIINKKVKTPKSKPKRKKEIVTADENEETFVNGDSAENGVISPDVDMALESIRKKISDKQKESEAVKLTNVTPQSKNKKIKTPKSKTKRKKEIVSLDESEETIVNGDAAEDGVISTDVDMALESIRKKISEKQKESEAVKSANVTPKTKNKKIKTPKSKTKGKKEIVPLDESEETIVNGDAAENGVISPDVDMVVENIRKKISEKQQECETVKSVNVTPKAKKSNGKTPAAYVKKRIPQTEPRKTKQKQALPVCPDSEPQGARKRVRIALAHNTSQTHQEYAKSLEESPTIPFCAKRSPAFGLLKSKSPTTDKPQETPVNRRSRRNKTPVSQKRSKAADFF